MSTIHELSPITPVPEFDLFAVPPTQATVEKDVCYEYRPISTLDSKSSIEFVVESNSDEYINFHESFLYVKLQFLLSKLDKSVVDDNDWNNVSVSNYLLHSLFQHVDLFIGDRQINTSTTTYATRAYLEALLFFDEESKNTYLQSSGWFKDKAQRSKQILPNTADKSTGRLFELMGRVHLDLTFQERAFIGGTTIRLKMVPNDVKFFLQITDANLSPQITFKEVSWFLQKSKVTKDVVEAHERALSISPAKYIISRNELKSFSVGKGSLDCCIENAVHGQLPRRMFICLVSNDALNGSFTKDPFFFEDFNVNFVCCYIDGMQFPLRAFTPDFKNNNFTREYLSLFQSTNQIFGKINTLITSEEYKNGNVIYGFNFAPDLTDGCCSGHVNLIKRGTLRVEIHFSGALKETVNVLLFCEFDNIIQINEDREAVTDYN